mmetsp:Transcript_90900/g.261968  ORF Transcript_90900/g.261968 Transcript_90900/m.261968 type:complete len:565 (-) Transcript_90900:181-1875(-)
MGAIAEGREAAQIFSTLLDESAQRLEGMIAAQNALLAERLERRLDLLEHALNDRMRIDSERRTKRQPSAISQDSDMDLVKGRPATSMMDVSQGRMEPQGSEAAWRSFAGSSLANSDMAKKASVVLSRVSSLTSERKGSRLHRFVGSSKFETFFGVAIIAHAAFLGVQTDAATGHTSAGKAIALGLVNLAFTLLFAVELMLKLWCMRRSFFVDPILRYWNWLDLVTVGCSFFELGVTVALGTGLRDNPVENGVESVRILRIIRVARLFKIVRVFRVVRFIRALRTMVYQLLSTAKPLFWAGVLLSLIIYVFAILFVQATLVYRSGGGKASPELLEYWSKLPTSMFSLLLAVTGGINWVELATPLNLMGQFPVALFILYVALVQFAVLNILTGVFCQNAIDSAAHDQELIAQAVLANKQAYIQNMEQLFSSLDVGNAGSLTVEEFMSHLNEQSVRLYFESLDLDVSDVGMLFRLLEQSDHEQLEVSEFISGCFRMKGNAKGMDLAKLSYTQRAMAKRMANFAERTDRALQQLLELLPAASADHHPEQNRLAFSVDASPQECNLRAL